MADLSDLAEGLPTIRSQVADIRAVYDSGRKKVRPHDSDPPLLSVFTPIS